MANKCVFSEGISHPYNYCVKDLPEMIDYDKIRRKSGSFNLVGVTESVAALINYTTALVTNPSNTISDKCKNILGNRYILKTQIKCKDGVNDVHTFMDNIPGYNPITGRVDPNVGIIPAAVGAASKINAISLMESLNEDPNPECIEVKLPCHIVDRINPSNTYTGISDWVHISKREYDKLVNQGVSITKKEGFKNIYESLNDYFLDNEIIDDLNKNNKNNNNNKKLEEKDNLGEDILVNTYYLFVSLFFLFITYKLLIKK